MLLVALAFVIGGTLGAVITATIIASNQRSLGLDDVSPPTRPSDRWKGDPVSAREAIYDAPERVEPELVRRPGREAPATSRERVSAARRALRPTFGITIRVRE